MRYTIIYMSIYTKCTCMFIHLYSYVTLVFMIRSTAVTNTVHMRHIHSCILLITFAKKRAHTSQTEEKGQKRFRFGTFIFIQYIYCKILTILNDCCIC